MHLLLIIIAALLVTATLIPLSRQRQWYIRALDFPRLQIAILSIAWLLLWQIDSYHDSTTLSVCAVGVLASLAYQIYWIYPNTKAHGVEIERYLPERQQALASIKLLSSNVLMDNRNVQALLSLVHKHQPDILITLESDQWWQEQLDTLDEYPHRLACPLDNLYGMHIYSKHELVNPQINYLVEDDKPSMTALLKINNGPLAELHVLHPAPPAPGENDESIERDVELLIVARQVANKEHPVIVAGDLNDVAWSATTRLFQEISGLKSPRTGRGLYNTFSAHHWFIRWPLDHVFVSSHFKLIALQRLPDIGSDHFPLLAEMALMKTAIKAGSESSELTEPGLLEDTLDTRTAKNTDLHP